MISPVIVASRCTPERVMSAELLCSDLPASPEALAAFDAHLCCLVAAGGNASTRSAYEWTHGSGGAAFDALCFLSSRAQQLLGQCLNKFASGNAVEAYKLGRQGFACSASALKLRARPDFIETPCSSHEHTSTQTFVRLGHALRGLQSLALLHEKLDLTACSGTVEGGPVASRAQALALASDSAARDLYTGSRCTGWTDAQYKKIASLCIDACFHRLAAHAAWYSSRDAPGDVGLAISHLRQATAAAPPLAGVNELLAFLEDRNTRLMETVPGPRATAIGGLGYAKIPLPPWILPSPR